MVSKKIYKSAVRRNRIRRRVYEIVRQQLPKIESNRDLVFIVFSAEILTLPNEELVQTINQMLGSANVYKK